MCAHALEGIDQVGVRIDGMQPAGHIQALHNPNVVGSEFGPTEQPGLALMKSFA